MAKNTFLDWDTTANNNSDVGGINIAEGCPPSNINNAIRETMAQLKAGVDGKVVYAAKAGAYTALLADNNAALRFTATATLSLTAAATLGANWHITVIADGGDVTIDPNGAETIDGASTLVVSNGYSALIVCNGSAFFTNKLATTVKTLAASAPSGHLYGLTLSNNVADATNDIDIATGSAASDATSPVMMTLAAALTKRLDGSWAVGTNQGGLDTGSIANTTYHVWLIQRSDTGVVDALFSASATSPTMPTNYDRKRLIGSIMRESAAIVPFVQVGDYFYRSVRIQDVSATNPGTAAVTRTLSVPVGRVVTAFGVAQVVITTNSVTSSIALITALSQVDSDPATVSGQVPLTTHSLNEAWRANGYFEVPTNTSAQVRSRLSASGAATQFVMHTEGWIDTRGRT